VLRLRQRGRPWKAKRPRDGDLPRAVPQRHASPLRLLPLLRPDESAILQPQAAASVSDAPALPTASSGLRCISSASPARVVRTTADLRSATMHARPRLQTQLVSQSAGKNEDCAVLGRATPSVACRLRCVDLRLAPPAALMDGRLCRVEAEPPEVPRRPRTHAREAQLRAPPMRCRLRAAIARPQRQATCSALLCEVKPWSVPSMWSRLDLDAQRSEMEKGRLCCWQRVTVTHAAVSSGAGRRVGQDGETRCSTSLRCHRASSEGPHGLAWNRLMEGRAHLLRLCGALSGK
jgi:hypothetical protein